MPTEVLQRIFIDLDDENLWSVFRVCKRFATIVETAFGQKYSIRPYEICGYSEADLNIQLPILTMFR